MPPERMMDYAQTDRVIIGIHLLKKLHIFYYPKYSILRHFSLEPKLTNGWLSPEFFFLLIICIHFLFQRHFNIGQAAEGLNRRY